MLLQRLKAYADQRMQLPPCLYSETPIGYIVEIDSAGRPLSRVPTPTMDPTNPATRRGVRRFAPDIVRSSGVKALLLADQSEYTFGLARDPGKQSRVDVCHRAYRELLDDCAAAAHEPAVDAVRNFYANGGVAALDLPDDFDLAAKVTFRVHFGGDAVFPTDLPAVQQFWAGRNDPEAAGAATMQCLVCGSVGPVLSRLQGKIKGVRGGQTSGTSIISANAEAFESFGLEASLIAPTCAGCGERFTKAANELIASDTTHLHLGNATFIFWTVAETGFSLTSFLTDPDPAQVKGLLDSARSGSPASAVQSTAFYAAALSGSGGRTAVRDWVDTTVGEVQRQLARWFDLQRIVEWDGSEGRPLGLYQLARATVFKADDIRSATPRALLHAALTGTPVQPGLLYEAVRRNRAEQKVTRERAALIKLVLLSRDTTPHTEEYMVGLEPEHPDTAYHCGRLLAVLESVQRRAMPNLNATIVDRFFGTASSAPASVFGRLLRGSQPHLSKLERDRRGAYINLQRELEDVTRQIPAFPKTLTLEQQGLFALGYYHQRAHRGHRADADADTTTDNDTPTTNQGAL
ncbi:MAG: type I-C CRISPR-associated protein Cas8c/Csd1 [Chloroflexi bacterium]|nr:type I-C CRISPR-associated protein Cas8c/Csd1 [Chloroflexota bacterium]